MKNDNKELNGILIFSLILNIFRAVIGIFTTLIALSYSSVAYVVTDVILHILLITSLGFILAKKKLGVYIYLSLLVGTSIAYSVFDGDWVTHLSVAFFMGIIFSLLMMLRKNGQSAWKTIMGKDSHNSTLDKESSEPSSSDNDFENIDTKNNEAIQKPTNNIAIVSSASDNSEENVPEPVSIERKETLTDSNTYSSETDNTNEGINSSFSFRKGMIVKILGAIIIFIGLFFVLIYVADNNSRKSPEYQFSEANRLFSYNQQEEAFAILDKLAEDNYTPAQSRLAELYLLNDSVDLNIDRYDVGLKYIKRTALSDSVSFENAMWFFSGTHPKNRNFYSPDLKEMKRFAELAIKEGLYLGPAYRTLGYISSQEENYSVAFYNFQKGTEYNDAKSFRNLGVIYYNGFGCEVDYFKALNYLEKAIELGVDDGLSEEIIGIMYRDGEGVAVDYVKAKEFLRKSAELGNEEAQSILAEMEM